MIAQISHTSNTNGIVTYHTKKIEEGVAEIISERHVNTSTKSNITASINSYNVFSKTERPTVHISINFPVGDRGVLSQEMYVEIGERYLKELGYGEQPYVMVKHMDQAHPHIHIVTTKVTDNGKTIATWGERYRSQNISRKIELDYNLTQVSSIKNSPAQRQEVYEQKDYKNLLRNSVKEALSLRPKRYEDLELLLRERYGIAIYRTKQNGIGFAALGNEHERYINGFGTKGVAGSNLDKAYSGKAIRETLSKNFKEAPKRYRNLKATEDILVEKLAYFDSISSLDFKHIFEPLGKELQGEEKFIVVDTKGKNVFSERDLKQVDFKKIQRTTQLKHPVGSGLFKVIADETFRVYKSSTSRALKTSKFISEIATKEGLLKHLQESSTLKIFEPLLSESQLKELRSFVEEYLGVLKSELPDIISKEDFYQNKEVALLHDFAKSNGLNPQDLLSLFRLNTFHKQYVHTKAEQSVLSLIERTLNHISGEDNPKKNDRVGATTLFDVQRFISLSNLVPEQREYMEKELVGKYLSRVSNELKREVIDPKSLVAAYNKKGFMLSLETSGNKNIIKARMMDMGSEHVVKGLGSFLDKQHLKQQQLPERMDDIRFNHAMDTGSYGWAYSMIRDNMVSPGILSEFKDHKAFEPFKQEEANKELIGKLLYEYKLEGGYRYTSDLKEYLIGDKEDFKAYLKEKEQVLPEAFVDDFLKGYTSQESLNESIRSERERFANTLKLAEGFANPNMAALLGIRFDSSGRAMDLHGKYTADTTLTGRQQVLLVNLQKQPYFEYYSNSFQQVTHSLYGDKRELSDIGYDKLMAFELFKDHIPEKHRERYQVSFERPYIEHFVEKLATLPGNPLQKIDYLNSKGIRAVDTKEGVQFKLGGTDKLYLLSSNHGIDNPSLGSQVLTMREHGFTQQGSARSEQYRFVIAMEKGNYNEAAWLLLTNKAKASVSELEPMANKKLQEELSKLSDKGFKMDDVFQSTARLLKDDIGGDGHYSGKKSKGKRKGPKHGPRIG
ncbi:relaxase/mobilization nuclease domain-containing protein [Flavobacterium sp. ASW18X]|uniref:relaxase/mobilization nuclease domain-containing protein n=1 Tax=Flavobacterium sp. ASW18X TaxID=2572595 RepID=UPI0010AE44C8|nr:relaxase/mobilization nuclease domain-containing protein [Flavobacterium sp. ASW18X]TKD58999.1 hypothetical protein FBT53_14540 [Flavobacterium sp. ASW18X]